jgi:membrane fusion protein
MFRREVHEHVQRAGFGGIVLIRPVSFAVLTAAVALFTVVVLAYLCFGEYTRKSRVAGMLVPADGIIRVAAPRSGEIRDRRIVEGQHVKAGAPLMRLVEPRARIDGTDAGAEALVRIAIRSREYELQKSSLRLAADLERIGIDARLAKLRREAQSLSGEIATLEAKERFAQQHLERQQALELKGFISLSARQAVQAEALEQALRLQVSRRGQLPLAREIVSLEAEREITFARARAQIAGLASQEAALEQERIERESQREIVVIAPQDGVVTAISAEAGQVVAAGTTLLALLPMGSPLEAHLFAASRAIGFLRIGQDVLLRFPAFPYQKFGSTGARIASISRTALPPNDLGYGPPDGSREPVYRIKVALHAQSVTAYGKPEPLQAGMQVEADVLVDRRRLIEWVFEPLLSLAGRA